MIQFSCIITVYAGTVVRYFEEAILSITNQTVRPNEILIVIDGPLRTELELFIDDFIFENNSLSIRKISIEKNAGSGIARNIGIQNARYEWIAIMDCDDYSIETRFEKQISAVSQFPELDLVSTLSDEYLESFENEKFCATKKCPEFSASIKKRLNYNCCITNPSIFFRKAIWEKTGGYGYFRFLNEDHYFFLKISRGNFKFYCIQESLIKVRTGKAQRKRRSGWKLLLTDFKFRYHCLISGLIDIRGFLILVPLFFRRFTPSFLLPYFHKLWRSV